jgi:hypothetical protein
VMSALHRHRRVLLVWANEHDLSGLFTMRSGLLSADSTRAGSQLVAAKKALACMLEADCNGSFRAAKEIAWIDEVSSRPAAR